MSTPLLREAIKKQFERHIESGGLITSPDTLVDMVCGTVSKWVSAHAKEYRDQDKDDEALALRDLANVARYED